VFRKIEYANGGGVDYKEQQINDLNSWDNDEIANFLGVSISQVAKDRQRYIREAQSVMMLDSYGEGGSVDEMYFFLVNDKNDKFYKQVGYVIDETIKDNKGNEFEKLYFENKKVPKKYNVNELMIQYMFQYQ
jgi:hypothetical protein